MEGLQRAIWWAQFSLPRRPLARRSILTVPLGKSPWHNRLTVDTVVGGFNSCCSLEPIDVATGTPEAPVTFAVGEPYPNPIGMAITPDSRTAFVVDGYNDEVDPINLATGTAESPITGGADSQSDSISQYVAITPDQAPTAAFSRDARTGGLAYYFRRIGFEFSDRNDRLVCVELRRRCREVTTTPTTSHTYSTEGSYSVTLTVTNTQGTSSTQTFTGQTVSNNGGPSAVMTQSVAVPVPTLTITGISFQGTEANPTIVINGTGFRDRSGPGTG